MRKLLVTGLLAALGLLALATTASGALHATISGRAQLHGTVTVTGVMRCTAKQKLTIRLFVLQPSTGALAQGNFPAPAPTSTSKTKTARPPSTCSGTSLKWTINAIRKGKAAFKPGAARACVVAYGKTKGSVAEITAACAAITL
ncbi:MAG TPA: hypothetical protein VJT84_14220 [Gaiellaceae bacterium]|nr:hypothetical protein [Gaiellaceae bacterium]